MVPLAIQIIFISKLDHMTPEILSIFPYNWMIYFTHSFNPTTIAVFYVIMYYSRNKVLRNAFAIWMRSILRRDYYVDPLPQMGSKS